MPDPLWTPADLAARWRCSVTTVLRRVRDRGLPFLWLGAGPPRLSGPGRALVRFKPDAVERWEAEQEGRCEPQEAEGAAAVRVPARGLARGRKARARD